MAGSRYARNLRRLRWALLGGAAATLVAVGVLYWTGRSRLSRVDEERIEPEAEKGRVVSSGFDYTASEGDRPLFRIRGGRVRMQGTETVDLDDVQLTLFRPDGEVFELTGGSATYDRVTQAARIAGRTRLVGPRQIVIETEVLQLEPGGRRLRSETPVDLSLGAAYRGEAQRLDADVRAETFLLAGGVRLVSKPTPGSDGERLNLTCSRLLLDRTSGSAHAEGEVRLQRGRDHIEARRLSLQLDAEQQRVEFLRARWDVQARFLLPGADAEAGDAADRARARGGALSLRLVDGLAESMELEGKPRQPARLMTRDTARAEREIQSPYILARFAGGVLHTAEAEGPVDIAERPAPKGAAERHARAGRAEASFRQGELAALTLQRGVELEGDGVSATGDAAYLDVAAFRTSPGRLAEQLGRPRRDVAAGTAELFGKPARARSERGDVAAPRLVHTARSSLVQAFDGVEARLEGDAAKSLAGGGLGGAGGGPVRVEAKEGFVQDTERTFGFSGDVRAWRDDQLLLADRLRGDERSGTLAADGHVRTVWRPAPSSDATPSAPPPPVEIDAGSLIYRQSAHEALYEGGVAARQAGRTLSCQSGRLELDGDDRLRRFVATSDVRLEEPAERRTVTGSEATYDLAAETIVVRGAPAVLLDPVRGRAEGRRVIYDLPSGRLRLLASDDEAVAAPAPATTPGDGA